MKKSINYTKFDSSSFLLLSNNSSTLGHGPFFIFFNALYFTPSDTNFHPLLLFRSLLSRLIFFLLSSLCRPFTAEEVYRSGITLKALFKNSYNKSPKTHKNRSSQFSLRIFVILCVTHFKPPSNFMRLIYSCSEVSIKVILDR